jgi:ATP/maltotriose-dependent transcriptional regulator MalT/DNA-binding SARP family transcriptional activator
MSAGYVPSKLGTTDTDKGLVGDIAPLIVTKTQIPRRRPDLLPRSRLVNFFHAHLDRKLILISAPAGYGKTTLLTDLANDTDLPVCWYTLDTFDQDLRVFLEYLISAIARRFPSFGDRSRSLLQEVTDPGGNIYPIVATMVQEIYDTIPEYFVLVLDDHHTVGDQEQISEFLDLFVTYVDENCHVILASRTLPALPNLSLLVARRQAAGLSIDELRFTPHEIQALAQQNHNLNLSLEQAESLGQRTGGWITGLLLTAVPGWEQAQTEIPLRGRITVDLYDYLSRQVLDQQPAPLRDFLLASSVLDELSVDLCSSVLGHDRVADLIDQVRMRNLFVTEFEGPDHRLRYHDLFREFLQSSLRRQDEARFRGLTRRAAEAYAALGEWERAVSRYLTLHDYERVADVVDYVVYSLFDAGRWDTLAGWIDVLPEEIREAHPRFLLQRGRIHAERGEHAPALVMFEQAERVFLSVGDGAGASYVLATKGSLSRFQGQYAKAIEHCREALRLVNGDAPQERFAMALAHKNIGLCQLRMGKLAEGQEALQEALDLYVGLNTPSDVGLVHHDLGLSYELAGDLAAAVDHYQAALQRWQQTGSSGPWANTLNGLGVVYYLQGDYDKALPILNDALTRSQQAGDLRVEAFTWASLGDLHRDLGAHDRARQSYSQALKVANRAHVGFVVTYALDALGNTHRLQGDLVQARKRLQSATKHAKDHKSTYEIGLCHVSLGVLAGQEGDRVAARHHLDQAVDLFATGGFQQELGRARLHRAQMAFSAGEEQAALDDLKESLAIAGQLGFDQFLVVDGQQMQPLLRYAAEQEVDGDALTRLLERIKAHQARVAARPEVVIQADPQPALKIVALGQPQVELGGESVHWTLAKSRSFLFCLLQHPLGLRKGQIGEMLWPDHDPDRLDSAFRSTLYRLRRTLFRDSVIFEDGVYSFNWASDYWFDVKVFETLLGEAGQSTISEQTIALLKRALPLYKGDYLEGIFADWSALERERLQKRYLFAVETLAGLHADRRELQRAIELYQHLLAQDSYREVAHRELMRCYYRLGDRAAAIKQYQICVEILREDLGLDPAEETEALYLQIID